MTEIRFRGWSLPEKRMYPRAVQKLFYVLLCDTDFNGEIKGCRKASHGDVILMQATGVFDVNHVEIFEGDIIEYSPGVVVSRACVDSIPDMYRSRGLHPLHSVLTKHQIEMDSLCKIRVIGNRFETPGLMPSCEE